MKAVRKIIALLALLTIVGVTASACDPPYDTRITGTASMVAAEPVVAFATGTIKATPGWGDVWYRLDMQRGVGCANIFGATFCKGYETVKMTGWTHRVEGFTAHKISYNEYNNPGGLRLQYNCQNTRDRRAYRAVIYMSSHTGNVYDPTINQETQAANVYTPYTVYRCG